jgi:predicted DNA-binding transcriptional regulator YafY
LHPLKLREVQDVWYLIGYEEAAGKEKTFGLDRMGNLSVTEEPCQVPEATVHKVNQLFAHIYGITDSEGPVEEIRLSFTPRRGKYVKAKPIHPSQQVLEDDEQACVIGLTSSPTAT